MVGLITGGGGAEINQMIILALKDARELKRIENYLEVQMHCRGKLLPDAH